jgi:ribonuclease HI
LRTAELAELLRRLAETLSFARLLEDRPDLAPRDLRRVLVDAAGRLDGTGTAPAARDAEDESAPADDDEPELEADGDDEADVLDSGAEEVDRPGRAPTRKPASLSAESLQTLVVDVYVDGASKGNPGPSSVGYVIAEPGGIEFVAEGRFIGRATNNEAEYRALLRALEAAERYGFRRLRIHSDSQLLVRQLEGRYRVNSPQLRALHEKAKERLAGFDHVQVEHVPRERNARADALANEAVKAELRRQKTASKRRAPG